MRFYYDTEFLENGSTIELISIGIVAEDGREYYAVSSDMPVAEISKHDWLCKNVVPYLPVKEPDAVRTAVEKRVKNGQIYNNLPGQGLAFALDYTNVLLKPDWVIANEVREFFAYQQAPSLGNNPVELWSWYGAYDHVALMQLWGPMNKRPPFLPMYTRDIQQEADRVSVTELPGHDQGIQHNALHDARYHKQLHDFVIEYEFGKQES
jgi:hypothetical protein